MLGTPQDRRKWSVLSGLFLVYMASNGITLHTLPLLYPELIETFGWRASEVTLPATVFFVVGALTSPPAGWLLDRYSSRLIIALGGLLLCIGLVAYGMTQTLWQLVAVYALLGLALSLCGLV
ncbi:MFS transporter, partial [Luminiphilus sp.]|nr:MFS transporter [Luminiphilus sp.]